MPPLAAPVFVATVLLEAEGFFLATGALLVFAGDDFAVLALLLRAEDPRATISDWPGKISGRRSPFDRMSDAVDV